MTRNLSLSCLLVTLAACGTTYVEPELAVADEQQRDATSPADLKLQLAEEEGPLAVADSGFRSSCDAELCVGDIGYLDVYVSEVLADPTACTDSTGEWIEVYNRTDFSVDLNGAIVEDGSSGARSTLSNVAIIPARSYAVIGKGNAPCGVDADGSFGSGIALNNGGDRLNLRRPDDALIDNALTWPASMAGVSFETSPEDGWRWLPAMDAHGAELATPGAGPADEGYLRPLAQVPAGALQITEVMADPLCAYDRCEWIEVRSTGGWPVDLTGLTLLDDGGNEDAFDGVVLGSYERGVFGRGDGSSWDAPHIDPIGFYGNVGLNNGGEQLFLMDGDRVLFATPFFPSFTAGASVQYNGWGYDTESLEHWSVSVAPIGDSGEFGTPGTL